MDAFGFIVLIVVYMLVVGFPKKREKRGKNRLERLSRAEARPAAAERREAAARPVRERRRASARRSAPPQAADAQPHPDLEAAGEGEDPCHEGELRAARPSVRLAKPTREAMETAGEGEDPCHVIEPAVSGSASDAPETSESPVYDSPILGERAWDRETLARQALAGVVMSEVLKRPAERRMEREIRRKMRRGA